VKALNSHPGLSHSERKSKAFCRRSSFTGPQEVYERG
jgi:hypothetical protein